MTYGKSLEPSKKAGNMHSRLAIGNHVTKASRSCQLILPGLIKCDQEEAESKMHIAHNISFGSV